jgi:hypothetical protein
MFVCRNCAVFVFESGAGTEELVLFFGWLADF